MIQVLGDRVLVALPPTEAELTTPSGIVLMRDPDLARLPTRGIVVQLGEKSDTVSLDGVLAALEDEDAAGRYLPVALRKRFDALAPAPFDVQVGDCVLFSLSAGEAFTLDDVDYVILHEAEIIGIVEPKEKAA